MSFVGRPGFDPDSHIAALDRYAASCGLPAYSGLMRAVHAQDQRSAELYAALRQSAEHAGSVQVLLSRTGIDQPRAALEHTLAEALDHAASATEAADIALFSVESRLDLDGRTDVTVLADARVRLRAGGGRL